MDTLLLLAELDAHEERTFAAIAATSKLDLVTCTKIEAALAWLEAHEPRVVVFEASVLGVERLCNKVRSLKNLSGVPLIALLADISDTFIERLYSLGTDDVMSTTLGPGFVTRLKTLPDRVATAPHRGMAVVADADRERSNVIGRVLGNAGYDVKLAHDHVSLAYYVQNHKPRLVVASASLTPARSVVTDARRRGCVAPWVVTASRRELTKHAEALAGLERVSVVATSGAPETVLYAANELMRGELPPTRSEERHLYGTSVLFRPSGDETDELGFTYNLSVGGVFVRTLVPIERDSIWLELRPPRCRQCVRLEGHVAWRRAYVPTSAATGPPGFGVRITGGMRESVALWRAHVAAFVQSAQASALGVSKLHAAPREDARTSGEYMLLEVPSESHQAVVRAVGDASTNPPAADQTPEPSPTTTKRPSLELVVEEPRDEEAIVRPRSSAPVIETAPAEELAPGDLESIPPPPSTKTSSPPAVAIRPRPRRSGAGTLVAALAAGLAAGAITALVYFGWRDAERAGTSRASTRAPQAQEIKPPRAPEVPAPTPIELIVSSTVRTLLVLAATGTLKPLNDIEVSAGLVATTVEPSLTVTIETAVASPIEKLRSVMV